MRRKTIFIIIKFYNFHFSNVITLEVVSDFKEQNSRDVQEGIINAEEFNGISQLLLKKNGTNIGYSPPYYHFT